MSGTPSSGLHYKVTVNEMNLQETATNELVERIKLQAELFQKPNNDDAVWNELMKRYGWVGCPKEDLALIGSLDVLLRPLNKGYTMLPPRIRQLPDAGIPPPPLYYQRKVKLSQVTNVSPTQAEKFSSPKLTETTLTLKPADETAKKDAQQTDNILPLKHHWSLAPLFWVTVAIMILTAILVWHEIRGR